MDAGVYYWASPVEAKLCKREEIVLVGGGNSAGQAIVYLATHAAKVHVLIRRSGFEATMSRYLIDRIRSLPNVFVHPHTEIGQLEADERGLASVVLKEPLAGRHRSFRHAASVPLHRRRSEHRMAANLRRDSSTRRASC